MEKSHTTVHDRFHVGCPACGFVSGHRRQYEAFAHAEGHRWTCDIARVQGTTVFDVMARPGQAQEWAENGSVISRRPLKPERS